MSSIITNLPIEVIDLIFGHLTMANDRRRTAQVCKLFNKVIRSQSIRKRDNILKLGRSLSGESIFRVFADWETLPFSKLIIFGQTWTRNIVMESVFWSTHGHEFSEIDIDFKFSEEKFMLTTLSSYFPNLKKLTIEGSSKNDSDIDPKLQNTLNCLLPIEELEFALIDSPRDSPETVLSVLRCSPHLKKLEIHTDEPNLLPTILPYLESVESSILHLYSDQISITKLLNLPSKIVFDDLTIKANEKPEMIQEFFKRPRVIEILILNRQTYDFEFNQDEEEDETNPEFIYFTREQVEALSGAKSIKEVELPRGVLNFGGSLDFLAQIPGLESISLNLSCHRPDQLYPLYWSSPETAKKIHEIKHRCESALNYLDGLSSLTLFSFCNSIHDEVNLHGLSGDEIQHLIRNCPNLKTIWMSKIFANDADLIGTGDLLPFSTLEKLENLHISDAPNITSEAFMSACKFPKLKRFTVPYFSEEPFNQIDAKRLAQNCPNVEKLELHVSSMKEEAFDYLIRNFPYLQLIHIYAKDTSSLNEEKAREMKKEFPYLKIRVHLQIH